MQDRKQTINNHQRLLRVVSFSAVAAVILTCLIAGLALRQNHRLKGELYDIKLGYSMHSWLPGESVETEVYRLKLEDVTIDKEGIPVYLPAPSGYMFVTVDLSIDNKSQQDQLFLPLNYTYLKDQTGKKYALTTVPNITNSAAGKIAAGDTVRGQIGFMIPITSTDLHFYFEPYGQDNSSIINFDISSYLKDI
ncbi:DUF4352 domain-containing protein [Candidatus Saccharibacteria bacterium]|nr:DUF4352 domain-containing protein [Candidatus Saccharibacteria bacterium]MCB9821032.1 DUF4352 domain-containing protein [Candidatus Nomurabacteria bacterium]